MSFRPPTNNHRGRCSVPQPSSPTLPTTSPLKRLGSPAPAALIPGEITGIDPRPDDPKAPSPTHYWGRCNIPRTQ
ncbi:unnamed protein product [Schistocephalus solidus]|uniref:Uncharacterized protein n=1 Tax=Schistocephalus solidus TaxID=70667 RepID=A0A183T895_SCHSO|nr:unnamed protein product [Schistocephalus solidus]